MSALRNQGLKHTYTCSICKRTGKLRFVYVRPTHEYPVGRVVCEVGAACNRRRRGEAP